MKTPDKIYIYMASPCDNHYSITPTDNITDMKYEVEYIRKDALLAWAEEEMMKAARSSEAYGRRNAFMDVIDKINSL